MVGMSGAVARRLMLLTPRARILPACTCGSAVSGPLNDMVIWPATTSVMAWPPLLYGTWISATLVIESNSAPARCVGPAIPADPYVSSPRLFLASAISSLTDFAGTDGCTTSIMGVVPISMTGAMSLRKSNGRLGYNVTLATDDELVISSV